MHGTAQIRLLRDELALHTSSAIEHLGADCIMSLNGRAVQRLCCLHLRWQLHGLGKVLRTVTHVTRGRMTCSTAAVAVLLWVPWAPCSIQNCIVAALT
jgi:hypothetical protein